MALLTLVCRIYLSPTISVTQLESKIQTSSSPPVRCMSILTSDASRISCERLTHRAISGLGARRYFDYSECSLKGCFPVSAVGRYD
ncbi:hypothetical protein F5148DRAFT_814792 [Russula earlei]|uniref:Uncharacterized protein n=1 Tax=Russula earlei TaxID=71964 RepID=A0ACC0UC06_9AGAM|nr:hypothetical protein F5148DRAFT_814792 [Russula earlei]